MDSNPNQEDNRLEVPSSTQSISNSTNEDTNCYSKETIDLLSSGVVDLYKPNLVKVREQLLELTTKQTVLIEQLHDENLKLSWAQNSIELQEMFNMVKLYQGKLLNIKKDMRSLHERSTKLKKRAARLQQYKEKEVYTKSQQIKLEQELVGKPGSSGTI